MGCISSPYPSEFASLSLEVENLEDNECRGTITIESSSEEFSRLNDFYRLKAEPQEGYVFDHWELGLQLVTNIGELVKNLGDEFVEKVEARSNYAFSNAFCEMPYKETDSQLRVNLMTTQIEKGKVLRYRALAYFRKA